MNYHLHYERLIDRARKRNLEGYAEKHHVQPRCIGGADSPENIVLLTPEEHYVAHQLLVKMHPGDHRLLWAAVCMTGANKKQPGRQNKLYGWLRRQFSAELSRRAVGRKHSPETLAKLSAAKLGKKRGPRTAETRAKISAASKGVPKSEHHREALSNSKRGKKRGPHSESWRKRQREGILSACPNPSGHRGVYFCTQVNKWKARIRVGGKTRYLGSFATPEEGAAVYAAAEREIYGGVVT